jgi:hypothetical protein
MAAAWRWVRLFLRDLWLHFIPGALCILWRSHRDPGLIGSFSKSGYRAAPLYQCRKCLMIYMKEEHAFRVGGRR